MPQSTSATARVRSSLITVVDVVSTVTSVLTGGIGGTVGVSVLHECLPHLPTKAFLARLLHPNRDVALRLLRSRTSEEEGQQNARCNYHVLTLKRGLRDILDGGQASWAQRRLLAALRDRFIKTPNNLTELRGRLAVALERARSLHQQLRASHDVPALSGQQYFVYCLGNLLDILDTMARDDRLGRALLARPYMDEWAPTAPGAQSSFPAPSRNATPINDLPRPVPAMGRSKLEVVVGDVPHQIQLPSGHEGPPTQAKREGQSRADGSSAVRRLSLPQAPAATPLPLKRNDFLPPWWRTSSFVLGAAALGALGGAWVARSACFAVLPVYAAGFAAAAASYLAVYLGVRLGRAAWQPTPCGAELLASAPEERRRAEAHDGSAAARAQAKAGYLESLAAEVQTTVGAREHLGRWAFGAPAAPSLAPTVGACLGAAIGAGAAWHGLLVPASVVLAAPVAAGLGALLGLAWAMRRRAADQTGGAPVAGTPRDEGMAAGEATAPATAP